MVGEETTLCARHAVVRVNQSEGPLVLISLYSCRPNSGSEPGAGWGIVLAAAAVSQHCVAIVRSKYVDELADGLARADVSNITLIGLEPGPVWQWLKSWSGSTRLYYCAWQFRASRAAKAMRSCTTFDVIHHATYSTGWLPTGLLSSRRGRGRGEYVAGPISGGAIVPRALWRYLGGRGVWGELVRVALRHLLRCRALLWRARAVSVIAQESCTAELLRARGVNVVAVHPHATDVVLEAVCGDRGYDRSQGVRLMYVGRLLPWKGLGLLLDALAAVPSERLRRLHLDVFGEGVDRRRLERLCVKRGLGQVVKFQGGVPRQQVIAAMVNSDALVFPSFHDSAGFAVSEALSLGLPVICLDHAGPGELVRLWPDVPSILIPVNGRAQDVRARLTSAIVSLRASSPKLDEVRMPIRTLVDVLDDVYQSVLEN